MRCVWGIAALMAMAIPARSEDCAAPCLGTTLTVELIDDLVFAAGPRHLGMNALQPEIEAESFFAPNGVFKLAARHTLAQVIDPQSGETSTFENLGVYTSELYGALTLDPFALRAGKFQPEFSAVNDVADVLKAADLAGNADMDESLGFEAAFGFAGTNLDHRLLFTAYTMDRGFLAGSLFTGREVPELADGGIGNSEGLSSFSLVLDGCAGEAPENCYEDGEFGYRLGARYQRPGLATADDIENGITPEGEWAGLAAASANFEIDERVLRLMGEAGYLHHVEGSPADAMILTAIAAVIDGPMTYTAALSGQWTFDPHGKDTAGRLAELSLKYEPEDGGPLPNSSWSIQAGYVLAVDEDGQTSHAVSAILAFEIGVTHELN